MTPAVDPPPRPVHRDHFEEFARSECTSMPLYAALSRLLAANATAEAILDHAAAGQRRPVLLLAALHDRVLELAKRDGGAVDGLGAWYPTVTDRPRAPGDGEPDPDELEAALAAFLEEHRDHLAALVADRSTQTNEPNRATAWYLGLRAATADLPATPVMWVELGASAGLNLAFDTFAYDLGGQGLHGAPDGSVVVRTELRGEVPAPLGAPTPPIASRLGVDLAPVDLDDPGQLRWLRACLWPEQRDRLARFDAAVGARAHAPHPLEAADAIAAVRALGPRVPEGHHLVVAHSWMLTYVERERRPELDAALAALAVDHPVSWLSVEAAGVVTALPHDRRDEPRADDVGHVSLLGLTRFRDGRRDDAVVARCHPHLAWIEWLGALDAAVG